MVLVLHEKKIIFLRARKVAGTSVELFLKKYAKKPYYSEKSKEYNDPQKYDIVTSIIDKNYHMTPDEIKQKIGIKKWNEYTKICIVRNPFDILISMFWWDNRNYFSKNKNNLSKENIIKKFRKDFFSKYKHNRLFINREFYDKNIKVDYWIRYENLNNDLQNIMKKLNINAKIKLTNAKSGIRDKSIDREEYYTTKMVDIVKNIYEHIFTKFNYNFLI